MIMDIQEPVISRPVRIVSTGRYLPGAPIPSSEIDKRSKSGNGYTEKFLKIKKRHFVDKETSSEMAALAAEQALKTAGWNANDLDLIVSACAVMEQPIPSQSVLIQEKLGLGKSGKPVLDVNSTCLSFLAALDTVSYAISSGRYNRVLIVSSEIASRGLDWNDPVVCGNFGDGAAAVLLERDHSSKSNIVGAQFSTFSEGAKLCELRSGGTKIDIKNGYDELLKGATFEMDGTASYKLTLQHFPKFLSKLLNDCGTNKDKISLIVPHQASAKALHHLRKMVNISKEKIIDIFSDFGNQISVSIPMALHEAITSGRLKRGDEFLMVGTAAGITLGGMVLRY